MIANYCILSFINDIISTNTVNWDEKALKWDVKQVKTDG